MKPGKQFGTKTV